MNRPPEFLDGARVVQFAPLKQAQPTGKTRHIVNGTQVSGFAAIAVAQYDEDSGGAYLFYCDESWNVVTDTWHEDVLSAVKQANFEFGLLPFAEVSGSE
jgi:hypothetical protein